MRFPDGTKMQSMPMVTTIISQQSKEKYGFLAIAKQEAFLAKLCTGTSCEFSQNLLLVVIRCGRMLPYGTRETRAFFLVVP